MANHVQILIDITLSSFFTLADRDRLRRRGVVEDDKDDDLLLLVLLLLIVLVRETALSSLIPSLFVLSVACAHSVIMYEVDGTRSCSDYDGYTQKPDGYR